MTPPTPGTTTKTRRTAPQAPATIFQSLEDCDVALRQIAEIKVRRDRQEADLNEEITKRRQAFEQNTASDAVLQAQLEKNLEDYVTAYRDEVMPAGRKSLELTHGIIDFRQHPPAVAVCKTGKWTIAKVIQAIKEHFTSRCEDWLRTKEELNKEALVAADPSDLAIVGLEIQRKETFGYTLKLETHD